MDENLSGLGLASVLNAVSAEHGCTFLTFPEAHEGADDADVPGIANEHDAAALLSINVQDFGAKEEYFRALVAAGISVVVLRVRNRDKGDIGYITSTLAEHVAAIARHLNNAEESVVVSVDKSGARPRSLREILDQNFGGSL
jgi:hypothetical protein